MKPSERIMADAREAWALSDERGLWSEADGAARAAFVLSALLQYIDEQHDALQTVSARPYDEGQYVAGGGR